MDTVHFVLNVVDGLKQTKSEDNFFHHCRILRLSTFTKTFFLFSRIWLFLGFQSSPDSSH